MTAQVDRLGCQPIPPFGGRNQPLARARREELHAVVSAWRSASLVPPASPVSGLDLNPAEALDPDDALLARLMGPDAPPVEWPEADDWFPGSLDFCTICGCNAGHCGGPIERGDMDPDPTLCGCYDEELGEPMC